MTGISGRAWISFALTLLFVGAGVALILSHTNFFSNAYKHAERDLFAPFVMPDDSAFVDTFSEQLKTVKERTIMYSDALLETAAGIKTSLQNVAPVARHFHGTVEKAVSAAIKKMYEISVNTIKSLNHQGQIITTRSDEILDNIKQFAAQFFPASSLPLENRFIPATGIPEMNVTPQQRTSEQQASNQNAGIVEENHVHHAEDHNSEIAVIMDDADKSSQQLPDEERYEIETVLVPARTTVISSSRDGKIARILVDDGDVFKKGQILVEYDCADLDAEIDYARADYSIASQRSATGPKLLKLDLIGTLDAEALAVEEKKAEARMRLAAARRNMCIIEADFDGRVTNRLANPGEYTRTDRVIMEISSTEPLRAEFLAPSLWLRWINVGTPLSLYIAETGKTYEAAVIRIHGEVDPVSQSIQMVAQLDPYHDRLLPGMSGRAIFTRESVAAAGIEGYLADNQDMFAGQ